ncbi:hypothetical protein Pcinc_019434 [Petrolisthes cinctipes]|uniref:Uncharacterized protein n=1 Tax=Petrolisthes cinctipes TaxID=88211 RepID=A0AAE1FKB4_PETCI|nr:hypothetical protein Pcinc_019434 [Petrolisthes cinctipes]
MSGQSCWLWLDFDSLPALDHPYSNFKDTYTKLSVQPFKRKWKTAIQEAEEGHSRGQKNQPQGHQETKEDHSRGQKNKLQGHQDHQDEINHHNIADAAYGPRMDGLISPASATVYDNTRDCP